MSLQSVKAALNASAPHLEVLELDRSTATVDLAAEALGVLPGQIAKTLSLYVGDEVIILVTCGDARLDNWKYKARFGTKAQMVKADEVESRTGHPVGGVTPFGLSHPLQVYCDVSIRAFREVFPAGGAPNAAIRITPERLAELTRAEWVDVVQSAPQT